MQLPQRLTLTQTQNQWAAIINPILSNPILQGLLISNISLVANTPQSINHLLGQMQQGWFLVDNTAACEIYRTQPLNNLTLTLESTANTTVSLWVF